MDRKSMVILGVVFGGLFLALFGFLGLAFVAMSSEDGASFRRGDAIGVLEVKGVIRSSDEALKHLRRFAKDRSVKALLVRIESPGGAVAPSQELFSELLELRKKMPVVCSLGDVAASGGFYIAAGCQKIVANPGTLTGSIGVISQMPYLGEIADELGFRMVTIKSGARKDVGNPFREMTEEERAYYQGLMDGIHEQFIEAIAQGRGVEADKVRPVADGRVFSGAEAHGLGLVDQLGNFNDAVRLAAAEAGIDGEPRLQYPPEEKPFDFGGIFTKGGRALARGVIEELSAETGAASSITGPAYLMPLPMRQ